MFNRHVAGAAATCRCAAPSQRRPPIRPTAVHVQIKDQQWGGCCGEGCQSEGFCTWLEIMQRSAGGQRDSPPPLHPPRHGKNVQIKDTAEGKMWEELWLIWDRGGEKMLRRHCGTKKLGCHYSQHY